MLKYTLRTTVILCLFITACDELEPVTFGGPDDSSHPTDDTASDDTDDTQDTGQPNPKDGCTDGVDCRCDVLVDRYGDDIVFCEDFDNPRLLDPGVWQTNPATLQGAGWKDRGYPNYAASCGFCSNDNDGTAQGSCIPQNTSSLPGTGGAQIINLNRCIELNWPERESAVPSLNASNQTFDGNMSMAYLLQPASHWGLTWTNEDGTITQPYYQASGYGGNATLDRPVQNFSITRAVMFTEEVITDPGNKGTVAWKDDQFTDDRMGIFGTWNPVVQNSNNIQSCEGSYGGGFNGQNLQPYANSIWRWAPGVYKTWTENEGHACVANRVKANPEKSTYIPPVAGEWYCEQVKYTGWGSANMRVQIWQDSVLIIDIADLDTSNPEENAPKIKTSGLDNFAWNNYWNGGDGQNGNQGWTGDDFAARLRDNMVIKEGTGDPISCAEIGFAR